MLLGAVVYGAFDYWLESSAAKEASLFGARAGTVADAARTATAFPAVLVGPFQTARGGDDAEAIGKDLRGRLRDALARFDELAVISGTPPDSVRMRGTVDGAETAYGLTGNVEVADASRLVVDVRLTDNTNGRIIFARTFQGQRYGDDLPAAEAAIVREVAATIAQPYGVIHSNERANQGASGAGDARYRCLLESYEYWRTNDPAQHARARECLERATEQDQSFAAGFASLAELALQEERLKFNERAGDAPPLERALRSARSALEAKPASARAYQALMDVHFLRGEYALALAAGEKAIELNPYNPNIAACYGARLIGVGEIEKGMSVLTEAAGDLVVRPAWFDFYLFAGAYLTNDQQAAAGYAVQIVSEKSVLGLIARALAAMQGGNPEAARQFVDRLAEVKPGWRDDPRRELKRMFPAGVVAERLASDLVRAGGGAVN
jgi:TolB-like protein